MGCMAFRTLPNRLSADPVKPAVHLIRNSLSFAHWKERKPLAAALRPIYQAAHSDAPQAALDDFERVNGAENSRSSDRCCGGNGSRGFLSAYPTEVRKVIYTTNAIESLHMQLRKIVKYRGHFPNDAAAKKLRFLTLRNIEQKWKMPPCTWRQAANQFAILFGERFTNAMKSFWRLGLSHKIPDTTRRRSLYPYSQSPISKKPARGGLERST